MFRKKNAEAEGSVSGVGRRMDGQDKKAEEKKKNSGIISVVMISIMSLVFITIASLMLFVKEVTIAYICYAVCGMAIVSGIFLIVRYFVTEAYRNLNEYWFAEGVLIVSLGICGLLKVDALAGMFIAVVGVALLISGVVKLQSALDLRMMNDAIWFFMLIVSVAIIGFSMFVLLKPDMDKTYTWYVLLADGVLGLVNIIYLYFRIKTYNRAEIKAKEKQEEEIRGRIIKEQEEERQKQEEQKRIEQEEQAAQFQAREKEMQEDDVRYGFTPENSEPGQEMRETADAGETVTVDPDDVNVENAPERLSAEDVEVIPPQLESQKKGIFSNLKK